MSDDFESLLFGSDEPEPIVEKVVESAPIVENLIVVENPLPDDEYTCPKCGKKYRAIFLMTPVNHNCFACWKGR